MSPTKHVNVIHLPPNGAQGVPRGAQNASQNPGGVQNTTQNLPQNDEKCNCGFLHFPDITKTDKRLPQVVKICKTQQNNKKNGCGPHGQIRDSGALHRTGSQECLRNLAEHFPVVSLLVWLHMFFPHSLRAYLPGNKVEFTPQQQFQQYTEPESLNQIESTKQYDD